jgi:hypothetical protein
MLEVCLPYLMITMMKKIKIMMMTMRKIRGQKKKEHSKHKKK